MWTLRTVGLIYLLSGIWCALKPELAAGFLGFSLTPAGRSEFFAVYGGLQVGIALAMIMSSLHKGYIEGALYFSLVLSAGLLGFRLLGMGMIEANSGLMAMAILEAVFVAVLVRQWHVIKTKSS